MDVSGLAGAARCITLSAGGDVGQGYGDGANAARHPRL